MWCTLTPLERPELFIVYLETLATSYSRLSPRVAGRDCDVNALVEDVVRAARGHDGVEIETRLGNVPRVVIDLPAGGRD